MSSDGCLEVAWKGRAFPYLMHHPTDPSKSESYGGVVKEDRAQARKVAAGVWDGRAPQGFLAASDHGKTITPAAPPRKIVKHAIVGQLRVPMLILDTDGMSRDQVSQGLKAGFRGILCRAGSSNVSDVGTALSKHSDDSTSLFIIVQVPSTTASAEASTLVKHTLKALGEAKVDLLTCEMSSNISNTWGGLESVAEGGTARGLGLVGATLEQTFELLEGCKVKPVVNFMELHPLNSERKAVGQLMRKGVQAVALLPTGGTAGAASLQQSEVVDRVATESAHSWAEVLLKWATQRGTPVVVGSATIQLEGFDVNSFLEWRMNEEMHKVHLDALNQDKKFAQ